MGGRRRCIRDRHLPLRSRLTVSDVEIDCGDNNATGIGDKNTTVVRADIHGCENGFDIDNDFTVKDSYVWDIYEGAAGHGDGIQLSGGANILIDHNTLVTLSGTSAIISNPSLNSNVTVQNNLLSGGAYTLYCPRDTSTDYRVLNNRFTRAYAYGPTDACAQVAQFSGNIWDDTGAALTP